MARRILVLFPDEWDVVAARSPRYRGELEFIHEIFFGFYVQFRFPIVYLFTFRRIFGSSRRQHLAVE